MRQELAWGTAAAVAFVAAVGISSQSGGKPETSTTGAKTGQAVVRTKAPKKGSPEKGIEPQCADSLPLLEHFFLIDDITGPASCYAAAQPPKPLNSTYQTNFVIATLPDPLHTHFSLLFDRFVEAIQQGAQDEDYSYDSSWLPWETEEPSLALLADQDEADDRTEKRENEPGMILFRGNGKSPFHKALIVFIVGEESTRGIHRRQFENAVAWINALQPTTEKRTSVAILGPSFSGSFPSLSELLNKTGIRDSLNNGSGLSIFSGSASSRSDGESFALTSKVHFHSFIQDDETSLDRVCRYFSKGHLPNLAIISEDETAYGYLVAKENRTAGEAQAPDDTHSTTTAAQSVANKPIVICPDATNIYYSRDISTLRAAYQRQSMFKSSTDQSQESPQRKSLPTDLVDPSGKLHDTVRTYAGNQTPLSEESQLLGIVDVLRAHRVEYVILRSSNTLDPLFLANFLRRDYPEARVLVLNSDLLFQRGQDAMALSGVMTLSTYPLFSWAREWTALPPYDAHSHRVFPENSTEGTYIASRLLLQILRRPDDDPPGLSCELADKGTDPQNVFVPPLKCEGKSASYAPLPDYAPPLWTEDKPCNDTDRGCRPATWLSVITRNGTWPLASLNDSNISQYAAGSSQQLREAGGHKQWPDTPRSTKICLTLLCGLAIFHFWCCWKASFTAKPAFRAHFATAGRRHTGLVLIASYLVTLMALVFGWGCGIFTLDPGPPTENWQIWVVVVFVWIVTGAAVAANIDATRKLNGDAITDCDFRFRTTLCLGLFVIASAAYFLGWIWPIEHLLLLANRAFVYWRAMNVTSGVSPIVPFVALTVGLYLWCWYALHGLALFGPDRPRLPSSTNLVLNFPEPIGGKSELKLPMFSQDNVAVAAEKIGRPLMWKDVKLIGVLFVVIEALMLGLGHGVPIRNLGATQATAYSLIFCLAIGFYCSLILSEAWKIWQTWSSARQLLVFLDRMALRRTLSALRGFSWGSVWKMSGNVLDVRYKLLSRQLECLTHMHNSIRLFKEPTDDEESAAFAGRFDCKQPIEDTRAAGVIFADWYSNNYDKADAANLKDFRNFQKEVAETTGLVLSKLLIPASRAEKRSLVQVDPDIDCDEDRVAPPPSKNGLIRNAEELVCLTYLGFAQNLLGRIRTIVLGGVYLFIAMCVAVSSYPFDPRTLLSGILLCLFLGFGGTVIFVYADMHRDATLSHITNTKPGELGSEFWFKVIGYGAAPLLGLITQVFPEWSGFLFSWLQPGLSSLK